MSRLRVHYNRATKLWEVRLEDRLLQTERVILDSPARIEGNVLEVTVRPGQEQTITGDTKELHIGRPPEYPGKVKDEEMRHWCAVFDENNASWALWRDDAPEVLVTTKNLELDCHMITSEGVLHCKAQMLLNGRANRRQAVSNAKQVKLRTLVKFDQVIHIPTIKLRSRAISPGR